MKAIKPRVLSETQFQLEFQEDNSEFGNINFKIFNLNNKIYRIYVFL